MGEYNEGALIKRIRNTKNMTQESLAEGICEPNTLARYESGKLKPSLEIFKKLMKRMGQVPERYLFPVQTEQSGMEMKLKEISYAMECEEFDKVKKMIADIKNEDTIPFQCTENTQYLGRIEAVLDYLQEKIDDTEFIKRLKSLLLLSFPEHRKDANYQKEIYTENEILLLNNIATIYGIIGDSEKAYRIFAAVERYFKSEIMIHDYKPRYLTLINYSNLLGKNGEYDASIAICKVGIQWLINQNQSNCLFNFYYNIGRNMMEKYELKLSGTEAKELGKMYIWEAYQLCRLYPESKKVLKQIEDYYRKIK